MRIISGKFGGRRISFPDKLPVRPTTDFAKNGLFNILSNRYDFTKTIALDLFCGAGGISVELVSRGCPHVICVDHHTGCVTFLKNLSEQWGISQMTVIKQDALKFLQNCSHRFDLIIADPPFDFQHTGKIPAIVIEKELLNPGGCLVVEHPASIHFSSLNGFLEERKYGNVGFSIFGNYLSSGNE